MIKVLKCMTPSKFLGLYSLSAGSIAAGVVLIIVSLVCAFALLTELVMTNTDTCTRHTWKNVFSFQCMYIMYCVGMIVVYALMMWGVTQGRASIVISCFALASMWLAQTFVLMIILLLTLRADVNFASWVTCLAFGLISTGILIYLILVVCGYWLELQTDQDSINEI